MIKVLFVGTDGFPIPAIKGGAIQTLVTSLLDENEHSRDFSFFVVSSSKKEIRESYRYSSTHFFYFRHRFFHSIYDLFQKCKRKLLKTKKFKTGYGIFIKKIIKKVKPQLIVLESTSNEAFQICDAFYDTKVKIVYHVHADYLSNNTYGINIIRSRVDNFLVVSKFIGERLCSAAQIDKNKIYLLPNATLITGRLNNNKNIKKKFSRGFFGINEDEVVFVYCGRISPEKGCLELVKAFAQLTCKATLIVIGASTFSSTKKTKYVEDVELFAKASRNKIIFTGYLPLDCAFEIFAFSDVGVVPSVCNEAASLSVIEYRTFNLATIVSCVGGIPEYADKYSSIFIKYDSNFIVSLKTAIEELALNGNKRRALSERARVGIDKYSYQNYFSNFSIFVDSIFSQKRDDK